LENHDAELPVKASLRCELKSLVPAYTAGHRLPSSAAFVLKEKGAVGALLVFMAEWTGLEPATPGVTGRYSNQLNYHSFLLLVGADGLEPPTLAL
jgi:hypothetical protein